MSEISKKQKEINFGITDELKNFLNDWTEKAIKTNETNESKKLGMEAKKIVIEIVKREIGKIDLELKECKDDNQWFKLVEKIDKLADLVRWY